MEEQVDSAEANQERTYRNDAGHGDWVHHVREVVSEIEKKVGWEMEIKAGHTEAGR